MQINQIRINPLNCEKLSIEILAWNSFRGVCVCVNFIKRNCPYSEKRNERKSTTSYVIEKYFSIKSMKKNDQILLNFPSNIFSQKFYENESKVEVFCIYGFMISYNYMNLKNINSQVCYSIFLMLLFMLFNMLQYMLFVLN